MIRIITILLILSFCHATCEGVEKPLHLSDGVWNQVLPYLIPDDHPIKSRLDEIFSQQRAVLNLKSMRKAGFKNPQTQKWSKIVVAKHPALRGFLIKTYLDSQEYYKNRPEYSYWIMRIQGAHKIRNMIESNGWGHLFKVPKKWIYVLPEFPAPPKEYLRKNFVLVEEDMNILCAKANRKFWKSKVSEEHLKGVYSILEEEGFSDCAKIDNIPFAKDGRIAFIDTQRHGEWPVPYAKLNRSLPRHKKAFWKQLTKNPKS